MVYEYFLIYINQYHTCDGGYENIFIVENDKNFYLKNDDDFVDITVDEISIIRKKYRKNKHLYEH